MDDIEALDLMEVSMLIEVFKVGEIVPCDLLDVTCGSSPHSARS